MACSQNKSGKVGNPSVLTKVADIPMPGPAVRFDYQSLDADSGRLYISHMNADQMVVFDTVKREVVANLDGFKRVHGVWAVPELSRVYASVTGEHAVAAVDSKTLHILTKVGPITYPDGLAYAPKTMRVFVSDEHGNAPAVVQPRDFGSDIVALIVKNVMRARLPGQRYRLGRATAADDESCPQGTRGHLHGEMPDPAATARDVDRVAGLDSSVEAREG
jgi:DNA-binding beta-propeller fold protein YncE